MAYKLLDSNGNYMNINGMHKGTIVSPYVYNGMELYNENAIATNRYPFYSGLWGSDYRRVRIGTSYYYPYETYKEYVDAAYASTSIIINGRYSSSSYKNYEVYKDGNLVASGSYTSSNKDIYVCEKEANTSIIVSGMWDSTNSKFIYNITTNATIERSNSYYFNNGIVTTSTLTKNGAVAGYGTSNTIGITTPTQEEIFAMLPSDCVIMSATYSTVFTAKSYHSGSSKYSYYFRTDYDNSTGIITKLPGSPLGSISSLGYEQSGRFTRTGTSYLGKTYYLYYHLSNWSSGQYRSLTNLYYDSISSTTTATVKYRYFDEVHTAKINVTRTNIYTLPRYTLADLVSQIGLAGTVSISKFVYHVKIVDNFVSGTHYFKIFEGTTEKGSYGTLSGAGDWTTRNITYTADMTNTLVVECSFSSTGPYSTHDYMAFSDVEGENYITVYYTWTPPA